MTDTPADTQRRSRPARSFARRWLYPALVILAIGAVIWWIDARDNIGGVSSTGERYGVTDFAPGLVPNGVSIGVDSGDMAPNFLLQTMDGGEVRLTDFRGQPVILNFWATWCAPCRKEMPQFVQAYRDYADDGLVIIGINLQESESIIRPFIDDYGIEFPVLIDRDGEVGEEFRTNGIPETFFIDRDGIVRERYIGPFQNKDQGENVQGAIDQSDLDAKIAQILSNDKGGDGSE